MASQILNSDIIISLHIYQMYIWASNDNRLFILYLQSLLVKAMFSPNHW